MFVFSAAPYNCKLMMNSLHDWGRKSKAGGDFCRFCGKLYRTDGILSPLYNDFPRCYNNSEKPTDRSVKCAKAAPHNSRLAA